MDTQKQIDRLTRMILKAQAQWNYALANQYSAKLRALLQEEAR